MMIFLLLLALLPTTLWRFLRVVLRDPREPSREVSRVGLWLTYALGLLPLAFFWAPRSALFNASLALALSTVLSPTILGSMNVEGLAWLKDKVFIAAARLGVAVVLLKPLSSWGDQWFWLLAAVAAISFISRAGLYVAAGGSGRDYSRAVFSFFVVIVVYGSLVNGSDVTPCTWTRWTAFLSVEAALPCVAP